MGTVPANCLPNGEGEHLHMRADLLLAPGVQELDAANGRSSVPLVSFDHVLDAQRGTGTSVNIRKSQAYFVINIINIQANFVIIKVNLVPNYSQQLELFRFSVSIMIIILKHLIVLRESDSRTAGERQES
jgi:hypothetical protein